MEFAFDLSTPARNYLSTRDHLFPIEAEILEGVIENVFVPGRKSLVDVTSPFRSNAHWTHQVKKVFADIGSAKGFLCYPQLQENGSWIGEWMLDFTWLNCGTKEVEGKTVADWKDLRGIKLGMECEWNSSESHILEDFQKLVHMDCEMRVFIYEKRLLYLGDRTANQIDVMKNVCQLSRGKRYLSIGYPAIATDVMATVNTWVA